MISIIKDFLNRHRHKNKVWMAVGQGEHVVGMLTYLGDGWWGVDDEEIKFADADHAIEYVVERGRRVRS